jgi:hypothetical protein
MLILIFKITKEVRKKNCIYNDYLIQPLKSLKN